MIKEVKSRNISSQVENELWAKSAGRCQFNTCNKLLYQSPITLEKVNIAEKAHIYSFSEKGPRGWGGISWKAKTLNGIDNLMLMCHDCHKTIDNDKNGDKYSVALLKKWKNSHEKRVCITTGIDPKNRSNVVLYGSNIGEQKSPIQKDDAISAMFPKKFPANEDPIILSMQSNLEDKDEHFWAAEENHLAKTFQQQITPKIAQDNPAHFSLFALAPMPLLIKLGALFTDKISVETYQPIREPKGWIWETAPEDFELITKEPTTNFGKPVLILSLSAKIQRERVTAVLGEEIDIWEVSTSDKYQHNDFLRSSEQLAVFRKTLRSLIEQIAKKHGNQQPLEIFPAIPVSCAIELGRIRMPKANSAWVIYDQNNKASTFIKTIEIKE